MILAELKVYLRERGQASLSDLALHFDSEPEALRGMLELWVRKGRVRRCRADASCGGCRQCDPTSNELYQWVAADESPQPNGIDRTSAQPDENRR